MIFIFVVLACTLVEGSALDTPLRCNKVFHEVNNHRLRLSHKPIKITLKYAGVPDNADEVVVYTTARTGWTRTAKPGDVVVDLLNARNIVTDTRKIYYHTYEQSALSYSSENMVFPVQPGVSRFLQAQCKGDDARHVYAHIQVIGYYTTHCKLKS